MMLRCLLGICLIGLFLFKGQSVKAEGQHYSITGFTKAYSDIVIGLSEAGIVSSLHVQEGKAVQAGELLLSLDRTRENLALQRQAFLAADRTDLDNAQRRYSLLQAQYKAMTRLFKEQGAVSQNEYEAVKLDYWDAQADLTRLKNQEDLEKIELALAQEQLARRVLKSPIAGVVARIAKQVGESVSPHEKLIRIVDPSRGYFIGNVESRIAQHLFVGQSVCLQVQGQTNSQPALISFLSPTTDAASGLMEVKAVFDNEQENISLGLAAQLRIGADTCDVLTMKGQFDGK